MDNGGLKKQEGDEPQGGGIEPPETIDKRRYVRREQNQIENRDAGGMAALPLLQETAQRDRPQRARVAHNNQRVLVSPLRMPAEHRDHVQQLDRSENSPQQEHQSAQVSQLQTTNHGAFLDTSRVFFAVMRYRRRTSGTVV